MEYSITEGQSKILKQLESEFQKLNSIANRSELDDLVASIKKESSDKAANDRAIYMVGLSRRMAVADKIREDFKVVEKTVSQLGLVASLHIDSDYIRDGATAYVNPRIGVQCYNPHYDISIFYEVNNQGVFSIRVYGQGGGTGYVADNISDMLLKLKKKLMSMYQQNQKNG